MSHSVCSTGTLGYASVSKLILFYCFLLVIKENYFYYSYFICNLLGHYFFHIKKSFFEMLRCTVSIQSHVTFNFGNIIVAAQ